jgi:hypothetical protein
MGCFGVALEISTGIGLGRDGVKEINLFERR